MELNGGSVVAMIGKDCVAIASDLRLGNQATGVAHNFSKVCLRSVTKMEFFGSADDKILGLPYK